MKIGTTRVETFSDGVIAIIITIMVLELKFPDINQTESSWQMRQHLKTFLPYLVPYAFSFLMIGIFWTNHHHMFHLLHKTDEPLLFQNLFFLFWISLIPVSTAMISANARLPDSVAVYGFIMLMSTFAFAVMRAYTIKKGLVHRDENKVVSHNIHKISLRARTKNYLGSFFYLISIPLAYFNIYVAYACLVVPPILFFIPDGIDDEDLAQKIEDKNNNVGGPLS
ncbi:MAG TPA: TMEM175 family protein [Chitinophagaceae bacterium]|jgi:uncharacterized membrane protein|nr:TMEM175 family protein [Chitinophagaceae bacterium]